MLAGLLLVAAACTSTETGQAGTSPSTSASTQSSPSESPSGNPTTGTGTPSTSPSSPAGAALAITGLPFHGGEAGLGYPAVALTAAGGTPPYQWSIVSGTFPPGLTLSAAGVVNGATTAAGHFSFTVRVSDAAGGSASSPATVGIYAALAVTQPCAAQCAVEEGCTVCGGFGSVGGGLAPYHYSITSDSRPGGMGVNGLSLTGKFPAPGPLGNYGITVQVSDQFGAKRTVSATWYVFSHIVLSSSSATCTQTSASCTVQVTYSGGTPGGTTTVTVGPFLGNPGNPPPPRGYTVSASGGTLTFVANGQIYTATVTIVLSDQSLCGPGSARCSARLTITINL